MLSQDRIGLKLDLVLEREELDEVNELFFFSSRVSPADHVWNETYSRIDKV